MFIYIGNNPTLKYAVTLANELMESQRLADAVNEIEKFDMTEPPEHVSGFKVWKLAKQTHDKHSVYVKIYYPWWRFSKAYGYFTPKRPFDINLNGYKLNRSPQSFVGTLVHELIHMADNLSPLYFGHGDNSPIGKENTAPYSIGSLAANLLGDVNDIMQNHTYKKRESLCTKIKKLLV